MLIEIYADDDDNNECVQSLYFFLRLLLFRFEFRNSKKQSEIQKSHQFDTDISCLTIVNDFFA